MTQIRDFDFHAPEDTERLNVRLSETIRAGIYKGFEVRNGTTAGFISIKTGVDLVKKINHHHRLPP